VIVTIEDGYFKFLAKMRPNDTRLTIPNAETETVYHRSPSGIFGHVRLETTDKKIPSYYTFIFALRLVKQSKVSLVLF